MRNSKISFAFLLVFMLALSACAGADNTGGNVTGTDGAGSEGLPETGSGAMVGGIVTSADGTELGTVSQVLEVNGREYVVLNMSGLYTAVPSSLITNDGGVSTYQGDASILLGAPTFTTPEEIDPAGDAFLEVENYWASQGVQ